MHDQPTHLVIDDGDRVNLTIDIVRLIGIIRESLMWALLLDLDTQTFYDYADSVKNATTKGFISTLPHYLALVDAYKKMIDNPYCSKPDQIKSAMADWPNTQFHWTAKPQRQREHLTLINMQTGAELKLSMRFITTVLDNHINHRLF